VKPRDSVFSFEAILMLQMG